MTQLASDADVAVAGDPVVDTAAALEAAPIIEEQNDLAALYPEDEQREVEEDQIVNDQADGGEGDEQEHEDEQDEPEQPAIDPPHSWKAEEKERWAILPRETQAYLAEREADRERFVNAKAQEAAQARKDVQQQAIAELAQIRDQQAQQYQQLAQAFFPQPPDEQLLYTGNPQDHLTYQQQEAAYRRGLAQQQQLQRAADEHTAQAQQIREDQDRQANEAEAQRLREAVPELFDAEKGTELQRTLTATAKALGYPDDLLPEATATDVLALRAASEWKSKADKWDAYQKARMAPVRAAKKLPVPNKPGSGNRNPVKATDAVSLLYPND